MKHFKIRTVFSITTAQREKLRKIAYDKKVSMAAVIREAIDEFVRRYK